jgi:hypothetical protein
VLPVATEDKERLTGLSSFTLCYNGHCVAILRKPEFYPHRKEERVCRQFGTCHKDHPYIKVRACIYFVKNKQFLFYYSLKLNLIFVMSLLFGLGFEVVCSRNLSSIFA